MKVFLSLMISCFIALSSFAQYSDVTLKVNGNKNRKVVLDGRTYTMTNTNAKANNKNITITDLQPGKHTIQVLRNTKATSTTVTTFTLRNGYDVIITVNGTGAVQVKEKKRPATPGTVHTPMTTTDFNTLKQDINNQWQAGAKLNMINSAFTNTKNFFTTAQAMQLIQLIDAEGSRLQLAKVSYRSITDPANFNNVATLLNDKSSRNELQAYINNYNNPVTTTVNGEMNTTSFNALLKDIQAQWQAGAKQNMINNAFANTSNYFTASQARQLIQLVDAEESRLLLAKASYRSIVDRENFNTVSSLLSNQASRNELSLYINEYINTTTGAHVAMNAAAFSNLLKDVQGQWQSGAKLNMLLNAFSGANYFTASQVRQLVQTVDAESSRLQLAKAAYKTVTDPSNYGVVSELLEAQASRNDLAAYIRNGGEVIATAPTGKVAMTDANFQSILDNVNAQWIPGTKMMMLQDVFANTANYFSSAQVKQLVAFVSVEANRLQLLKASYRNVTDRTNFTTTYEMLATQATRDELTRYVQAYKD
jgi:hypothetical protein